LVEVKEGVGVFVVVGVGVGVGQGLALVQVAQFPPEGVNTTPELVYSGPVAEYGKTVAHPLKSTEFDISYVTPSNSVPKTFSNLNTELSQQLLKR
jgi:hypothetical protein